jgi:hypothetical protein
MNKKLLASVFLTIALTGCSSGSSSSSSAPSKPAVDVGTHMACEHWRLNLHDADVMTDAQIIAGAQKVNDYASVSEISAIVTNAHAMTVALLNRDTQGYLKYGSAFGDACTAVGE